ncbi:MAG: ABC transporter permease subunit [Christensenellales bacterium]
MANYIIRVKIGDTSLGIMTSKALREATLKLPVIIPGSRIHLGLVFALILVIVCFLLMYRSKLGYAIRMTGKNSAFARYVGTSSVRRGNRLSIFNPAGQEPLRVWARARRKCWASIPASNIRVSQAMALTD